MMKSILILINKTIFPYFEQDELIDIIEKLIKELAKLEKHSIAHRDIRPENFLIQHFDKHKVENQQLWSTEKVNSLDISKNERNFEENDQPLFFEHKNQAKRQSLVPELSKINKLEDLIAKKMNKNSKIVKVGDKSQAIKSRDPNDIQNFSKTIPITPSDTYQKLVLNGLEGNLNQVLMLYRQSEYLKR